VKRHPALVPLSHDHHHALVRARELRRAATAGEDERRAAAARFRRFFADETGRHFREEEEQLFPLLDGEPAPLVQALREHQRLRALVRQLGEDQSPETLVAVGELLEAHVRLEERVLFPLLEREVPRERLERLALTPRRATPAHEGSPVVDLTAGSGRGPIWGAESDDLNVTLLAWPPGEGTPAHRNAERDVVLIALAGSGTLELDGESHSLQAGEAVLVAKGSLRRLQAGDVGLRYLTVHLRRPPLGIARRRRV
jgi:quercetin dioxygenase-like cupin family protein